MPETLRLGILREGKVPPDNRVPFTPEQAKQIEIDYPHAEVYCQSSTLRCFTDDQYREAGVKVVDDIRDCDILLGVKEVPIEELIPEKTYLFFSHTIKKQAYNRPLLQAIVEKNIRLIDYEKLTDDDGNRIVAFGRFAGIVGAYNGLYTYGLRHELYQLKRAKDCYDMKEMHQELRKVQLPPVKIVLTGGGRVAYGVMEILDTVKVEQVDVQRFLYHPFDYPVYVKLDVRNYNYRLNGGPFDRQEFFLYPQRYGSAFRHFTQAADLLVAAAYWDSRAPVLFTVEEMQSPTFSINVIADITCDIEGSIPSTIRPSTIDEPVYDYDPFTQTEQPPFSSREHISVMAIDNLPSELPRDASASFGESLHSHVLPSLLNEDSTNIVRRATITEHGALTMEYRYLQNYLEGKE